MMKVVAYELPDQMYLEYDPQIPSVFEELSRLLTPVLPGAGVEHIGSTSIPGMPGKNSINVLVAVDGTDFSKTLASLESVGFAEHPFKEEPADRPLRVGGVTMPQGTYWVHVHVVEKGSKNHRDSLAFRDYLRNHPESQAEYAALKLYLSRQSLDSHAYNEGKQPFIRKILALAKQD